MISTFPTPLDHECFQHPFGRVARQDLEGHKKIIECKFRRGDSRHGDRAGTTGDVFWVLVRSQNTNKSKQQLRSYWPNGSDTHLTPSIIITKTKRTSMWRPLLFSALANYLFTHSLVHGLSSPGARPEIEYRQFIQLTNPINTRIQQSIPVSFVRDWPTWVLDEDGILSKIPDDDGFVPPTSVDEVWHPVDLKRPGLKLALGLHV
jgi:hypothetical protein